MKQNIKEDYLMPGDLIGYIGDSFIARTIRKEMEEYKEHFEVNKITENVNHIAVCIDINNAIYIGEALETVQIRKFAETDYAKNMINGTLLEIKEDLI